MNVCSKMANLKLILSKSVDCLYIMSISKKKVKFIISQETILKLFLKDHTYFFVNNIC